MQNDGPPIPGRTPGHRGTHPVPFDPRHPSDQLVRREQRGVPPPIAIALGPAAGVGASHDPMDHDPAAGIEGHDIPLAQRMERDRENPDTIAFRQCAPHAGTAAGGGAIRPPQPLESG